MVMLTMPVTVPGEPVQLLPAEAPYDVGAVLCWEAASGLLWVRRIVRWGASSPCGCPEKKLVNRRIVFPGNSGTAL